MAMTDFLNVIHGIALLIDGSLASGQLFYGDAPQDLTFGHLNLLPHIPKQKLLLR